MTWEQHKATGEELHCIGDSLGKIFHELEAAYGRDNELSSSVIPVLEYLGQLKKKLGNQILNEDHRANGHTQITYVYDICPMVNGTVIPLCERESP